jgi:hypothetical protein
LEEVLVVANEVWDGWSAFELGFHSVEKVGDTGTKFDWNFVWRGFPNGVKEQLIGVILVVIAVSEVHLSVDITTESRSTLVKFLGARGEPRLRTEVQTKAK